MERAGLSRHAAAGQGHGLYAEALGQLRALPRRRPHLPYEQRRRAGAARHLSRTQIVAVRRLRPRGACGPLSCTRSSAPRSSTTSIRKLGSPMSSTVSPTCRRPVCTSSCPGPGRPTGNRPWPHNLRPLAARQLPTTTPPASRRSPKSWRMQHTGGAVFTGGVPVFTGGVRKCPEFSQIPFRGHSETQLGRGCPEMKTPLRYCLSGVFFGCGGRI